jgi:hypothetical protein
MGRPQTLRGFRSRRPHAGGGEGARRQPIHRAASPCRVRHTRGFAAGGRAHRAISRIMAKPTMMASANAHMAIKPDLSRVMSLSSLASTGRWRFNAIARPQNEVRALYSVPTTRLGPFPRSSAALLYARRSPGYALACRGTKRLGHTIHRLTLGDVLQRRDLNSDSELTQAWRASNELGATVAILRCRSGVDISGALSASLDW